LQPSVVQSPPTLHVLPVAQACVASPPQSTSVSTPFSLPSVYVGTWQRRPLPSFRSLQTSLLQSASTAHFSASAQRALPVPPQSTSVSLPFCTPSVGLVAVHLPPLQ